MAALCSQVAMPADSDSDLRKQRLFSLAFDSDCVLDIGLRLEKESAGRAGVKNSATGEWSNTFDST